MNIVSLLILNDYYENVIFNLILDAKGNSLFAEVDDQRQQMRDLLSRQKSEYSWVEY